MNITTKNSIQEILESYPESVKIFKKHGVDVEDHCLYSVRHLPIEECTNLCGVEDLARLMDKLNSELVSQFSKESIGELVAQNPLRSKVFDEFGLDFCCGGKQTLEEACKKRNVDLKVVLTRLADDTNNSDREIQWSDKTLTELIDNIESKHHEYLKRELPRLEKLSQKVAKVHGEKAPPLVELAYIFRNLKDEIERHTFKEEMVLFPYIRSLEAGQIDSAPHFGTVANPIRCMESEHEDAGQALAKIRQLTDDFVAPINACASWKALTAGLKAFDEDLRIHIHKENSILFPKALLLEKD